MRRSLRRDLRILQVYALASSLVLVFLAVAALGQPAGPQKLDELTVQRLNVVDADGTLAPGDCRQGPHASRRDRRQNHRSAHGRSPA